MSKINVGYYDRPEMSVSKFKRYWECPAKAFAVDQGRWDDGLDDNEAIAMGSYVDAVLTEPDKVADTLKEYSEIFFKSISIPEIKKKFDEAGIEYKKSAKKPELEALAVTHEIDITVPKSPKIKADKLIDRILNDPRMPLLFNGDKQVEWYGMINGVPFKCKPDIVNREHGLVVDLKSIKGVFIKEWCEKRRTKVFLWEKRGYDIQLGTYLNALGMPYGRGLLAMTGKDRSIGIGEFSHDKLTEAYQFLYDNVPQVAEWAKGINLHNCGECDYCLSTMNAELIESTADFVY